MADVRSLTGVPPASAFSSSSGTPIVVDRDAGTAYVMKSDGSVAAISGGSGGVPTSRTINTTAPLAGGGDLTDNRTLSVSAFSSGASGIVPASGGGTTNFLRADGTWSAPAGGGGASATAYVAFTGAPNTRQTANVVAASVTPASIISVGWGAVLNTDDNDPELDDITFNAIPGTGSFTLVASCQNEFLGRCRVNYTVA